MEEEGAVESAPTANLEPPVAPPEPKVVARPPSDIKPTTPDAFSKRRYDKKYLENFQISHRLIPAGLPSSIDSTPPGWTEHIHPEGQLYYIHTGLRIATESNVMKHHKLLEEKGRELRAQMSNGNWDHDDAEIFLNLIFEDKNLLQVYMVDHKARTIFYPWDLTSKELELDPVFSETHMEMQRKYLYWNHVEFFPMHIEFPKHECEETLSKLIHAESDGLTSYTSTSVYTPEQCAKFGRVLTSKLATGHKTCVLARLNKEIYKGMFLNFYGQPPARLDRLTRIYPIPQWNTHPLLNLVICLFFGLHEEYRIAIQNITVDGVINVERWKDFLTSRIEEWQNNILYSTVFWTVGISFMQAVPESSNHSKSIIAARGLMMSSVLCSMLSTATSLCHSQCYKRDIKGQTAQSAKKRLDPWDYENGYLALSIVQALPLILFTWAAVFAGIATLLYGFNFDSRVMFIVIFILITMIWAILMFRLFKKHDPIYKLFRDIWKYLGCLFWEMVSYFVISTPGRNWRSVFRTATAARRSLPL
ncbi:hypothetical protein M422DRAFT_783561 [Sphaerobolus stellatus SS14]|uniref:Unplaced genomic scaffold SPHSTscaffold_156, whole genome shotgun sequence n=1 Tax=Sphaerobolus stellatus (strain SS14) TaxID=990650 RepID=A0A0C9TPV4_SPHS4|nr:hypothetical protein M422DRAFT_783561 [Sphaerobolus stellatus SS14]